VAAENDMGDLKVLNGILNNGIRVDVCRRDDVGNVAVDKNITRLETEESSFGDSRIGAAEPDYVC
jgi:hypothetical protein